MTVNFFNHEIGGARFGLFWGADKETPAIALNPGDMASFDLDVFNNIPEGTTCKIFALYKGSKIFTEVPGKFSYVKGRGSAGTFNFYMRGDNPILKYEAA